MTNLQPILSVVALLLLSGCGGGGGGGGGGGERAIEKGNMEKQLSDAGLLAKGWKVSWDDEDFQHYFQN